MPEGQHGRIAHPAGQPAPDIQPGGVEQGDLHPAPGAVAESRNARRIRPGKDPVSHAPHFGVVAGVGEVEQHRPAVLSSRRMADHEDGVRCILRGDEHGIAAHRPGQVEDGEGVAARRRMDVSIGHPGGGRSDAVAVERFVRPRAVIVISGDAVVVGRAGIGGGVGIGHSARGADRRPVRGTGRGGAIYLETGDITGQAAPDFLARRAHAPGEGDIRPARGRHRVRRLRRDGVRAGAGVDAAQPERQVLHAAASIAPDSLVDSGAVRGVPISAPQIGPGHGIAEHAAVRARRARDDDVLFIGVIRGVNGYGDAVAAVAVRVVLPQQVALARDAESVRGARARQVALDQVAVPVDVHADPAAHHGIAAQGIGLGRGLDKYPAILAARQGVAVYPVLITLQQDTVIALAADIVARDEIAVAAVRQPNAISGSAAPGQGIAAHAVAVAAQFQAVVADDADAVAGDRAVERAVFRRHFAVGNGVAGNREPGAARARPAQIEGGGGKGITADAAAGAIHRLHDVAGHLVAGEYRAVRPVVQQHALLPEAVAVYRRARGIVHFQRGAELVGEIAAAHRNRIAARLDDQPGVTGGKRVIGDNRRIDVLQRQAGRINPVPVRVAESEVGNVQPGHVLEQHGRVPVGRGVHQRIARVRADNPHIIHARASQRCRRRVPARVDIYGIAGGELAEHRLQRELRLVRAHAVVGGVASRGTEAVVRRQRVIDVPGIGQPGVGRRGAGTDHVGIERLVAPGPVIVVGRDEIEIFREGRQPGIGDVGKGRAGAGGDVLGR